MSEFSVDVIAEADKTLLQTAVVIHPMGRPAQVFVGSCMFLASSAPEVVFGMSCLFAIK
jgi:hypothetical protein